MSGRSAASLLAVQTCFVVSDVDAAVQSCERAFGWGPFLRFSAPSPGAGGEGTTHVALGAAGATQVELLHHENVRSAPADYEARYGIGFQHLGVFCRDLEAARETLEAAGGATRETGSFPGIRFAFVDTPTGTGMLELLEPDANVPSPDAPAGERALRALPVESASIATRDIDAALAFYAAIFGWGETGIVDDALEIDGLAAGGARRVVGRSGTLALELIQPLDDSGPYARHLAEREHGLVHVGTPRGGGGESDRPGVARWRSGGGAFRFLDTPFGPGGVRAGLDAPAH